MLVKAALLLKDKYSKDGFQHLLTIKQLVTSKRPYTTLNRVLPRIEAKYKVQKKANQSETSSNKEKEYYRLIDIQLEVITKRNKRRAERKEELKES